MPPKMPAKLAAPGRALWKSVIEHDPPYDLRPDELRVLADACREADLIAKLEQAQLDEPLTTKGSMGQKVISPFISELRQHRTVLANLLKSLKLPDSDAGAQRKSDYVSEQARAAVRQRWGTPKGA